MKADVTNEVDVQRLVNDVIREAGRIDRSSIWSVALLWPRGGD